MDPWLWIWPIIPILGIVILIPTLVNNDPHDGIWWVGIVLVVAQVALFVANGYLLLTALNG